jgi:hypothetical protein
MPEFALSVAVVDTRRVLRVRETTARGVVHTIKAAIGEECPPQVENMVTEVDHQPTWLEC